jgi:cytochrome d ubiquinol oxidase subunit I
MQTPAGGEMLDGKFVVHDYFQAIANPSMANSVLHMFFATLETSLFVVGGISAWYILNNRHSEFFAKSFKVVLAAAIAVAPIQIYIGHLSGEQVYHYQPSKLAAMEAQWETTPAGQPADWSLVALPNDKAEQNDWEITVPNALGYILEFKKNLSEPVVGLKDFKPEARPHLVGLVYYTFRIMIAIGFFLAFLMLWSTLYWLLGKLSAEKIAAQRWLMRTWIFAAPLGFIAIDSGWIVRCVGRQPWTLYGQIRTVDSASNVPASNVLVSLISFAVVYTLLFVATLYFGSRIIRKGPNLDLIVPGLEPTKPAMDTAPGEFIPDERPVEAQQ